MDTIGEKVETVEKYITIGNRKWLFHSEIFFTGKYYDIDSHIVESVAGQNDLFTLKSREKYSTASFGRSEGRIEETIKSHFKKLVNNVKEWEHARSISVSIDFEDVQ